MDYKHITIAGGGVLGSQIAFQSAFFGFEVTVYDITEDALEEADKRFKTYQGIYQHDMKATKEQVDDTYKRISTSTDLAEAVKKADLVVESIPEVVSIKEEFYTKLGKVAPDRTVFASNSSTFLPSQFADFTGRPEKFLALHFANEIWRNNIGEVMKHEGTEEKHFNDLLEFAGAIGMVPIPIYKEQPGYILNSLLVPLLSAAQSLLIKGVSDPETIDKTWVISTGAPVGPFAFLDIIGLHTPYNLQKAKGDAGDEEAAKIAEYLKTEFIDKGHTGKLAGKGFYEYPNPRYLEKDFLK